ncbi:MAG TPA: argininosuccinate lyase [Longimicrobiales bacterium]
MLDTHRETLPVQTERNAGESEGKKLWGGRFAGSTAATLEELNNSLPVDKRLWREDIEASRAWVQALSRADVLTRTEAQQLDRGLLAVHARLATSFPMDAPDEDIHSLVERMLYAEVGEVAGKLHTGRSRNDQVVTDARLWAMRAGTSVLEEIKALQAALLKQAEQHVDTLMPAYTHLRRAQPVRVAHWLLSYFWALDRDRHRLEAALERVAVLPLGSGAIAGSGFSIDRTLLKELLGFRAVSANSLDAVGDRDWVCELVFVAAMTGAHLSRLAEDLIVFSTDEFGYVTLPEAYTTGSSLMPQKRNPDGLELARGKAARLAGDVAAALAMLKGLPSGYNKDMQEDKALLFSAIDAMLLVLPPTRETVAQLVFRVDALQAAANNEDVLATDIADELVRRGVPFREAHGAVGKLLRLADEQGVSLAELSPDAWVGVHPAFGKGPIPRPTAEMSVEARQAIGGTGRAAVLQQLAEAQNALG